MHPSHEEGNPADLANGQQPSTAPVPALVKHTGPPSDGDRRTAEDANTAQQEGDSPPADSEANNSDTVDPSSGAGISPHSDHGVSQEDVTRTKTTETVSYTDIVKRRAQLKKQSKTDNRDSASSSSGSSDELEGFKPQKKFRKTHIYVGQVKLKRSAEYTRTKVMEYMDKCGAKASMCRIIRKTDEWVSFKVNVVQGQEAEVLEKGFWPKGVHCRLWKND